MLYECSIETQGLMRTIERNQNFSRGNHYYQKNKKKKKKKKFFFTILIITHHNNIKKLVQILDLEKPALVYNTTIQHHGPTALWDSLHQFLEFPLIVSTQPRALTMLWPQPTWVRVVQKCVSSDSSCTPDPKVGLLEESVAKPTFLSVPTLRDLFLCFFFRTLRFFGWATHFNKVMCVPQSRRTAILYEVFVVLNVLQRTNTLNENFTHVPHELQSNQ